MLLNNITSTFHRSVDRCCYNAAIHSKSKGLPTKFHLRFVLLAWLVSSIVQAQDQHSQQDHCSNDDITSGQCVHKREATDDMSSSSSFKWNPHETHPCTIPRMTMEELQKKHGTDGLPPLYPEPIVIPATSKETSRNIYFRKSTHVDNILDSFPPGFLVTLSSSNSFSEHRRTIPFQQYLHEDVLGGKAETFPDKLSNETWYLFGETYSKDWKQVLRSYDLPPCHACKDRDMVALSFGIGNVGSGVQWHVHGPGFSEAIHGRKHWILYRDKPDFHPDQTSRNWMEYTYTTLDSESRPYECTLEPGDLIYFPDMWWHATINLSPYTAFVSTFTREHDYIRQRENFII